MATGSKMQCNTCWCDPVARRADGKGILVKVNIH